MSLFTPVNEQNFEQEVLKSLLPVLVEFGAEWCAPCKRLEPILAELADDWKGKIRLAKVDVDQSVEITTQYRVMSVPTLILFVRGQEAQRLSGLQSRQRISEKLQPHF